MVEESGQPAQSKEYKELDDGPEQDEDQGANHRVARDLEPGSVEVATSPTENARVKELLAQVGIHEKQKEDRVEELQVESQLGCLVQLLSLSWVAYPLNETDADCSQDKVESSDEVLERVEPDKDLELHRFVFLADLGVLRMVVG